MEVDWGSLVSPECAARLAAPNPVYLAVANLEVGRFGVLDVKVATVHPARTYQRKSGGQGLLQRVTLADASAEVTLVLWDEETARVRDGTFRAGARLRVRGATVQPGWKGGIELRLGSAVVEATDSQGQDLVGRLDAVGATQLVGEPPAVRFRAEVTLSTANGPAHVVLWDEAVRSLQEIPAGSPVRVTRVERHPGLDGWWLAGPGTSIAWTP
ncbi:MAG: hypothetical protein ACYDBQ_00780 [Thermoplasmatota archaeon]